MSGGAFYDKKGNLIKVSAINSPSVKESENPLPTLPTLKYSFTKGTVDFIVEEVSVEISALTIEEVKEATNWLLEKHKSLSVGPAPEDKTRRHNGVTG